MCRLKIPPTVGSLNLLCVGRGGRLLLHHSAQLSHERRHSFERQRLTHRERERAHTHSLTHSESETESRRALTSLTHLPAGYLLPCHAQRRREEVLQGLQGQGREDQEISLRLHHLRIRDASHRQGGEPRRDLRRTGQAPRGQVGGSL